MDTMRLLVFGSREWTDFDTILYEIGARKPDVVIEGEAGGADRLARAAAERLGIPVQRFPAQWSRYGLAAGPIRNQQMLDEGRPDEAIGFHPDLSKSKGSADMARRARKAGIPTTIYQHSWNERQILGQIDVPLRAQPGLVCVVEHVPICDLCEQAGMFDYVAIWDGRKGWTHGCLRHYLANRASLKLGVGLAQLWITGDQVGLTHLPRG